MLAGIESVSRTGFAPASSRPPRRGRPSSADRCAGRRATVRRATTADAMLVPRPDVTVAIRLRGSPVRSSRCGCWRVARVRPLVRVERDPRAVGRPRRPPRLELPFGDLHRRAAGRRRDVEMIPAVPVADERDPLAVGRRLRSAARVAGHAPERLLRRLRARAAARRRRVEPTRMRAALEVGRWRSIRKCVASSQRDRRPGRRIRRRRRSTSPARRR